MTLPDATAISCYREIAVLNAAHGVTLVQHTTTGKVYVKKILTIFNPEVYRYLRDHHINGIPDIVEVAEQDGCLIVVEEYISGQTLRTILDNGNLFPEEDAVEIADQLCRILQALHSAAPPILHRDIKPSNIIRTPDGTIRLLDMNAARQMTPGRNEDTQLIGTVGYAAPEQYGFGTSSVQTDIYSTGVLLCELMTGHLPKDGIPGGRIGQVIRKCTQLDPRDRYPDMQDLRKALAACRRHPSMNPALSAISSGTGPAFRYMIPGFRSGNPLHYLVAGFAYVSLLVLSLTYTAKGIPPGPILWTERIIYLVCGFGILLFTGNYLDIWRILRISRIRNTLLRLFVVFALDIFLAGVMVTFMIAAAAILLPA